MGFKNLNITIIGLGIIGGSIAKRLKKMKYKNIWGVDINTRTLKTSLKEGIIDKGCIKGKTLLKKSDIVIISLYPSLTVKFIKDNIKNFKSGAIITDTSGIKSKLMEEISEAIRDDVEFVGGHPMAGNEHSGFEYSYENMFEGCNYIINRMDYNSSKSVEVIKHIASELGSSNIIEIDAKQHDESIAFTSHLPHILAFSLMNSINCNYIKNFVGGSFKDATRVSKSNSTLWSELLIENKNYNLKSLEDFEKSICQIKKAIKKEDNIALQKIIKDAGNKREEIFKNEKAKG